MMYELYVDPRLSLRDIVRALSAQGMRARNGRVLSRVTLNAILRNPVYVTADLPLYEFFKSQGTEIINGAEDFTGDNSCYYYQGKGASEHKSKNLEGQTLVVAPHEGLIPSDLWIRVRKKLIANQRYQPSRKGKNSWLAGKIKCGRCGFALTNVTANKVMYFRCSVHAEDRELCPGCGTVRLVKLHELVYGEMVKKLKGFKTIKGRIKADKANPKLTAKQISLAQVDGEIDKLVESLMTAGPTLVSYVNTKIEELDAGRQKLTREISALTLDIIPPAQMDAISDYLDDWENVSFEDKQKVTDYLITRVRATSESVEIEWKI
jgi:hypothetical protein